jgi:hypothetical protein
MKTLGLRLVEASEGTASFEMEAKTEFHWNPWEPFMVESYVTLATRRFVQPIFTTLKKRRTSRVSICRSISFDQFGTMSLE